MPLHRIYAPAGLFSAQEKRQLANDLSDMYTAVGLPPFLVITLFVPIDAEEDFYIGRQSHAERQKEQGKPFVRIVSQHLARTAVGKERRASTIKRLEDRFRGVLEAKGCEWEVSIATHFSFRLSRSVSTDIRLLRDRSHSFTSRSHPPTCGISADTTTQRPVPTPRRSGRPPTRRFRTKGLP